MNSERKREKEIFDIILFNVHDGQTTSNLVNGNKKFSTGTKLLV